MFCLFYTFVHRVSSNQVSHSSESLIMWEVGLIINPLGSTNADMRFVASSHDNAKKNLNYTFCFDRTDKSNTLIQSVKDLLLFVYTHKTLCIYKIKKTNRVRCLPRSAWSSFRNTSLKWTETQQILHKETWYIYIYIYIESCNCLLLI